STGVVLQRVRYAYDASGRLEQVIDETLPDQPKTYRYTFSKIFPRQVESTTSPVVITQNVLDPQRGHLLEKRQTRTDGTLLANYAYKVNALGQREELQATGLAHARPLAWK